MPRASSGSIIETKTAAGEVVFALRFRALGRRQYVTLGSAADGWTRKRVESELADTIAAVRLGVWQSPVPTRYAQDDDPTLHVFASNWLASRHDLRPATIDCYTWLLSLHLLPELGQVGISSFDGTAGVALVDDWRDRHMSTSNLNATSINKCLKLLGQILDVANERGLVKVNPMRINARNRKVKQRRKQSAYLDRAWQVQALLDGAELLDRTATDSRSHVARRVMLSVLVFAGLRISELVDLRWRDIELSEDGRGRLRVADSKTPAGERWVTILPGLATELVPYWLTRRPGDLSGIDGRVFPTSTGERMSVANVRNRVFYKSVDKANELLHEMQRPPLPEGMTPHKLRHTYCTLRFALGHDIALVSSDLGHSDLSTTFRYYTHVARLDDSDRRQLQLLVDGVEKAVTGSGGSFTFH